MVVIGKRYGKLVVLRKYGEHITSSGYKHTTWLCQCDCGKQKVAISKHLLDGHTKSCGCIRPYAKFNDIRVDGDIVYIKVNDVDVMIDSEDLSLIYPQRVFLNEHGYAMCGKKTRIHRLITNCPKGLQVDHINRNKLDNRKCNLRIVTNFENQMNRPITSNTGEFGISLLKRGYYQIVIDGVYMGSSRTLEKAIEIRNESLKGTRQLEHNDYLKNIDIE